LSVYIIMSFDFPFVRLFGVRLFCYYPYIYCPHVISKEMMLVNTSDQSDNHFLKDY
jgi:hypothetical protein